MKPQQPDPPRRRTIVRELLILSAAAALYLTGLYFLGMQREPAAPFPAAATVTPAASAASATASPPQRRSTKAVKSFRDCRSCPEMVVIPRGSFDMGEHNQSHHVTIRHPFALGRHEVTQAEWQAVMGSNPAFFRGANLPVDHVNWIDVQAFIKKLNRKTGKRYRLPTEAEWEYACRANTAAEYCGGDAINEVGWTGALWYDGGNSSKTTHAVGLKQPNAFGLYDMSGNVWEWVADPWHPGYAGAPGDGSIWRGDGAKRVIRGGSWLDYPLLATASYRIYAGFGKRSSDLGFRLARDMRHGMR